MTSTDPTTTLICESAVEALRKMEAGSVDAAVFDPPYRTISGGSNDAEGGKHQRPSGILTKNDGKIFTHNDIKPSVYLPEVHRVLREDAHMYLMTNTLNLVENDILGDIRRAGFKVHNLLFWRKNNATPNRWYMKDVELVIFCRKGKAFPINNMGDRSTMGVGPHRLDDPALWLGDDSMGYTAIDMGEYFDFPLDWDNISGGKSHPTEKPVNLMKTYIENSTQPGEIVLDPFMGTGATGVAAQTGGRSFVGIELSDEYAKTASVRMETPLEPKADDPFDLDDLLGDAPEVDDLLG